MADEATPDRLPSLMSVRARPAIDEHLRTPLMLQLVLGLDVRRISGAFLVSPSRHG